MKTIINLSLLLIIVTSITSCKISKQSTSKAKTIQDKNDPFDIIRPGGTLPGSKPTKITPATTRLVIVIDNPTRTIQTDRDRIIVVEKGMASMMDVEQDNQKYQALHRTALVGSFVRVTNLSNGKLVVVSIIGKLPESTPKNVIIQLTKRAYDQVKATGKIPVEIDYDLEKE